ncbi:MAG: PD40 domain-containing protein [Chloroflexi bacterium]|nr:PD40 domain-containing protein [Chloroflexota bacterium]
MSEDSMPRPALPLLDRFDTIVVGFIVLLVMVIGAVVVLGDHVGVEVKGYSPKSDETPPGTTPIRVIFDSQMKRSSAQDHFDVRPSVEGTFKWENNDTVLIFTPAYAFSPHENYQITIQKGAESETGHRLLDDVQFSLTVRPPEVYFLSPSDARERGLWRVSSEGGEPEQVFTSPYGVFDFAPSPDGKQIAVTIFAQENLLSEIMLINPDGSNPQQITSCDPAACGRPSWSPDGQWLSYERQEKVEGGNFGPSRIYLLNMQSGQTGPAFQDNQILGFGAIWSPDSQQMAFYDSNIQQIRTLNLKTGVNYTIPSLNWDGGAFSPDGTQLVFTDIKLVEDNIYASQLWLATLPQASGEPGVAPLLAESQEDQGPSWSLDGHWIAFGRRRVDWQLDRARQVWLYNVASHELKQLTDEPNYNSSFYIWDPSSSHLLIQRFDIETQFPKTELWVYDLSTDSMTPLTADGYLGRWLP